MARRHQDNQKPAEAPDVQAPSESPPAEPPEEIDALDSPAELRVEPQKGEAPSDPAPVDPDLSAWIAETTDTATRLYETLQATAPMEPVEPQMDAQRLKAIIEPVLPPSLAPGPRTRCINCGETGRTTWTAQGFHCSACGHTWSIADEQSPFRKLQRGER